MISYLDNKGVNTFYIVYSPLYCTYFFTKLTIALYRYQA